MQIENLKCIDGRLTIVSIRFDVLETGVLVLLCVCGKNLLNVRNEIV